MTTKVHFSNDSLKIVSSSYLYWVITTLGIIILGSGVYLLGKADLFDHILLSVGMILFFSGLLLFVNTKYYKIHVNEKPGFISIMESSMSSITPMRIPLKHFNSISILPDIKNLKSSSVQYRVMINSNSGSSLFIAGFSNRGKALELGQQLQKIMGIDLTVDKNLVNRTLLDSSKRDSSPDLDIFLTEKSKIKKSYDKSAVLFKWRGNQNVFYYTALMGIIYGTFHLVHFVIMRKFYFQMEGYLAYGFFALLSISGLFTIIMNLFGSWHIVLTRSRLVYHRKLFGKKFGERRIKRDMIGLIRNSINSSSETICVISSDGLDLIDDIYKDFSDDSEKFSVSMISDFITLYKEIFKIDSSSLSLLEKFYIESIILKSIKNGLKNI